MKTEKMNNQRKILNRVVIIILIAGNIFWGFQYFSFKKKVEVVLENQELNSKVLSFTQFFIEKVLKTENEVDFETRLKLENDVRSLNNPDILTKWQRFTESKTEMEAQAEVKDLLEILVSNIETK